MGIAGTVVYAVADLDDKGSAPVAIFSTARLAESFVNRNPQRALFYLPVRIDEDPYGLSKT